MSGIKDQENIEKLRERLYQRGKPPSGVERHRLPDEKMAEEVPRSWQQDIRKRPVERPVQQSPAPTQPESAPKAAQQETVQTPSVPAEEETTEAMASKKKRFGYRMYILLGGVGFFVLAALISSLFLIFGSNNISGENITITITGPFTVGGGEVMPMQVGVTNDNAVPIEAATLIVNYPSGTQSPEEDGKELFTERLGLDTIGPGETVNVPLRAVVFGEENDEKTITVSVEYRVRGSNATFFKEAEPLRFKISSSPIIVRADTLKKISSGQETDVELTVTSNSPTMLSEVLVKAEYPIGFDYTESDPEPTNGQNMWLIENLEPESSHTITITGVVVGKETDEYAINFTVGVPNERDPQTLASVFATAQTEFEIEQPFLDVQLEIDGQRGSEVAIDSGDRPSVTVTLTNTLEDTIYDAEVVVQLGGNAFSVGTVQPRTGYYNSSQNSILWDVSNTDDLESINPGDSRKLTFDIRPDENIGNTPQLNIDVDVRARRVSERQVAEELIGTASSIIKVVSQPQVYGDAGHNNGIFSDYGPVPPEVGTETSYTLSLMIENGSNDISNAEVTASLPAYVTWLDMTAGSGEYSFNPTSRTLQWYVGDVEANAATFSSFQVSFLPTVTQIGTTPTLMGQQRLRADDDFTGTVVRDENSAVTTHLPQESGFGSNSGEVKP